MDLRQAIRLSARHDGSRQIRECAVGKQVRCQTDLQAGKGEGPEAGPERAGWQRENERRRNAPTAAEPHGETRRAEGRRPDGRLMQRDKNRAKPGSTERAAI